MKKSKLEKKEVEMKGNRRRRQRKETDGERAIYQEKERK